MTMQSIAGFNPTDVLSAAIVEKLHSLGANEVNVTTDRVNDAVTVYGSTKAGHRFGFRLKVTKTAAEATTNTESAPSASVQQSGVSSPAGSGNKGIADVYDVLIEIRDIVAERY